MSGYSQSVDLYKKALESAGTTQNKFNLYQQSTEAAINRLKSSFEALWMSTFNSDAIKSFVSGLDGLTKAINSIVSNVGLLPTAFGLAGTAFLAFNNNIRTSITQFGLLSTSLIRTGDAINISSSWSRIFSTAMLNMQMMARGTGVALEFLGASLKSVGIFLAETALPVAAFMAVGYAIQKVTEAIQNQKQQEADMKKQQDDLVSTYSAHSEEIDKLASKYEELNAKAANDSTVKNSKEYVDTMNQLGKLMPSLVKSTDEHGNSILKSRDAVKEELDYAKQLKDQYDKMSVANFEKDLDAQAKKVDDILSKIESYKRNASGSDQSPLLQDKAYIPVDKGQKIYDETQVIAQERELKLALSESKQYMQDKAKAMMDVEGLTDKLSSTNQKLVNSFIDEAVANKKSIKDGNDFKQFLSDTINKAVDLAEALSKVPKALNGVFSADQVKGFTKDQLAVLKSIDTESKNGYTNWESYRDVLTKVFKDSSLVNSIISALTDTTKKANDVTKDYSLTQDQIDKKLQDAKGSFSATKDVIMDMIKAKQYDQAITASQGQAYSALADELSPINKLLEDMANGKKLSAAEAMDLISKEKELAKYISIENGQVKINEQGVMDLRNAKIASYQDMINAEKAQIGALDATTQASLKSYGIQIKGIMSVAQANEVLAEVQQKNAQIQNEINNSNSPGAMHASIIEQNQYDAATSSINGIKDALSQLDQLSNMASQGLTQVGTSLDSTGKSADKSNSKTKDSIYVTDKYKMALDALNAQISKLENAQKNYATNSASYRNALQQEINLQNQKLKLMQDQEKSLEQQIKSGNIIQTGMISNSSSSSSSSYASGTSTSAQVWNYLKSQGLSDAAVAGIMGNLQQESSMNPKAAGGGLAQWIGSRGSALRSYAASRGLSANSLEAQLGFLWQELSSGSQGITPAQLNQMSVSQAAQAFSNKFERPGIPMMNNRIKYANQYYNQFAGSGGSSSSASGQSVADKQQAIDKAKSDLIQLQQDISSTKNTISELNFQLIESKLHQYDQQITDSENKAKEMDATSADYRRQIWYQWDLNAKKAKDYRWEIAELTKTEGADSAHVAQLKQEYEQVRETIAQLNWDYYTSEINQHGKAIDSLNSKIDEIQRTMQLSPDDFAVQEDGIKKQVDLTKKLVSEYDAQIEVEQRALQNGYLNAAQQAEMNKELENTVNLRQQEIDKLKELNNENNDLITGILSKQKDADIQHMQEGFDKLDKTLSNLAKKNDTFDFGNFSDGINDIINSLDELDGKFAGNPLFDTSTSGVRNNIADTKNKILDLSKAVDKLTESTSNTQSGLESIIRAEADQANKIYSQIQQIDNQIRDTSLLYKQQEDALQNQIDLKQQQLDQLDQQYQKEDRIKQLNDLMTQRDKVMADKRDEIIDANGNKQLTYDVAKVADLNKQIDDLNTQNARDDAKKALQDQINDMQKNLDKTKQIHQAELDNLNLYKNSLQSMYDQLTSSMSEKIDELKTLQDQQVTDESKKWDDLIDTVKKGTLTFSDLMNGWYGQTIASMEKWNSDFKGQVDQLKSAFADMQNIQSSITTASESPFIKGIINAGNTILSRIPKHHDGGIVGEAGNGNPVLTNLVNKLFNVKPNEQIVKALKGELMIPPKNIPNFFTNIGNLVNSLMPKTPAIVQGGDTYHLTIEKVVTEDASSFLRDLPRIIKTKKQ
jgi:hypothetical protein